jgi:prophage antirepressor-like protein
MKKSQLPALTHFRFEGRRTLTVLRWNGRPAWIAQELCGLLDVERPPRTFRQLKLEEGVDFEIVKALDIRKLFAKPDSGFTNDLIDPKTRNLTLVFESGLYALAFASPRTREIVRIRNWLTREVLPALRLQGFYRMPGRATAGDWRGVLTLFAQAAGGDTFAVKHLRRIGFTPEGDIPPAYRADPGPSIVARLIDLARKANRYSGNFLARELGLPVPPDLQLALPGVEE